MAATVSAWGKPGAWALDSEEQEAMEMFHDHQQPQGGDEPSADFPSLAAAAAAAAARKAPKKKKAQALSLAEFNNGGVPVTHGSAAKFQVRSSSFPAAAAAGAASKGLTPDERLMLPTGPRERTAEELERGGSRGFGGYYGGGGGRHPRMNDEDSASHWDSRVSEEPRRNGFGSGGNRDLAPSRADEIDDWGANKRSAAPPMERRERAGGFVESQSRADESDSWISNKSVALPSADGRRMGDGYREKRGFEMFNREASVGGGGRLDSDTWGRKREDAGEERPRLKLQPRTLPLANGDGEQRVERSKGNGTNLFGAARPREEVLADKGQSVVNENGDQPDRQVELQQGSKSKGMNPFGAARPREEVLAEKGQNWKEIDERLESMMMREVASTGAKGHSFLKKDFGIGSGPGNQPSDPVERSWRKADPVDSPITTARAEEAVEVEEGAGDN